LATPATHQLEFCFLRGTVFGVLDYPTVLSPAGNGSCSVALRSNSVSCWEPTVEFYATNKYSLQLGMHLPMSPFAPIPFPIGKVFGVTGYPLHISPAGNRSSSVTLSTSSFSGSKHTLGHWGTHQFSLLAGEDPAGSRYVPIPIAAGNEPSRAALPTSLLSSREEIFQCSSTYQFSLRQAKSSECRAIH